MAENLDAQLLNRNTVEKEEERQVAGQLRQDKRSRQKQKEEQPQAQEEKDKPQSLRQQLKNSQGLKGRREAGSQAKKQISPVRMGTNRALRWSWWLLIPSFGLSLIYIYLHLLMHFVAPNLFCGLGEEWQVGGVGSKKGSISFEGAKIAEWGALLFISMIVGVVFLAAFGFLYLLTDIVTNPIKALWTYGIKPIAEIIKNML